jgi:NitT/TauT family transport system permease protein
MTDRRRLEGALPPRWRIRLYQVAVVVVFLALWEYASDRWIRTLWISKPTLVAQQTWEWFIEGFIYKHILATLRISGLGLVVGSAFGIVLGLVIGLQRRLSELLDPLISAAYTLPRVALLPLLLVWFGFGAAPMIALVSIMIFFVLFYNTRAGVQSVDPDLVASMRVMGASRLQVIRMVTLPSIVPFVLAAMMIAAPYALIGAIVAEIFIGSRGLGFLIVSSTSGLDLTKTFSACLIVTAMGLVASLLIARHGPRLLGRTRAIDPGPSSAL